MAKIPDNVLNWLYAVLQNDYQDPTRTFGDVAKSLSNYPSLRTKTEVYTFENGKSNLLLLLSGTLPVQFRGETYRFPISLWVPQSYPREAPIVYVTPSQDMLIRPGQHVYNNGRIFHPYLAQWAKYWDKSSIDDFLTVLRGVFAKDPPVMSNQELQQVSKPPVPPPIPPPPKEYSGTPEQISRSPVVDGYRPPQLPPKQLASNPSTTSLPPHRTSSSDSGPPLPPLPSELRTATNNPTSTQGLTQGPPAFAQPNLQYPLRGVARTEITGAYSRRHELESPVSPLQPETYPQQYLPFPTSNNPQMAPYQAPTSVQQPPYGHVTQYSPGLTQLPQQHTQQYMKKPTVAPPKDLISSPLEVTLPSQTGNLPPLPAPPIPPNPEKEALLKAISQALVAETQRTLESNKTAVSHLIAQQSSLRSAHGVLQAEVEQLQSLDATLDNNERVLRSSMQEAEKVMKDAAGRPRPDIDDVLVCPTVVGSQLYSIVADEKACEDARVALGRGLDKGRITLDVFVKQTRSLAREEFLKKALIRKIALGMGLEEHPW